MKRSLVLFFSFLLSSANLAAQCPTAPITLSTQSQINNFPTNYPGCTTIGVSVTIQGSNISNLNGLSNVTSITKSLFIQNNPALSSLSGLSNLSNIGVELTIDNNDALTSLNGLNNLPFIGGSLDISNNALLNDLSALSGVAYINGYLGISFNPALVNLNGLNNVATIGRYLQINNNNALISLNSLNNLTGIGINTATTGRYLSIGSNPNMTTLNGLNAVTSVGAQVDIAGNGKLVTLGGLTSLSTINGYLSITNNPKLTNLDELANITSIAGNLTIASNAMLGDCAALGICNYLDNPTGSVSIQNNATGCNSIAQVQAACDLLPVKLIEFSGKAEDDAVMLTWKTAGESDNAFFQIEHSTDGSPFRTLGQVPGKNAASGVSDYSFLDRQSGGGAHYYRLKQVDFSGKYEYSPIISVFVRQDEVEIYPNPTHGAVTIYGDGLSGTVRVFDFMGNFVKEYTPDDSGRLDISDQKEGVYFTEIHTGSHTSMKRVVKE